MMRALALLMMVLASPALATVASSGPDGFVSENETLVAKSRAEVWAALVQWGSWWSPAHSYSSKAGALQLDAKAGGLLTESWDGKSVSHAAVVAALPPALLRMQGGFGPLQSLPVNAVLEFTLKPDDTGTRIRMTYRVGGPASAKLEALAAPVDAVMSEGFTRLVSFAATGSPTPPSTPAGSR